MFSYEALYENRKNEAGFVFNFSLSILFNRPRNSSFLCIMYIYPTQYPCKVTIKIEHSKDTNNIGHTTIQNEDKTKSQQRKLKRKRGVNGPTK
jgi:hypothetical protein